jgi:hypothetical protein
MKAENDAPTRKATVRHRPDSTLLRPSPVGSRTSAEVTKTTTASGTTMITMVRNWRMM